MKKNKEKDEDTPPTRTVVNRPQEGDHFTFTDGHVKEWGKRELMPPELVTGYLARLEKSKELHLRMKEYTKNNPNASMDQVVKDVMGLPKTFSEEESQAMKEDMEHTVNFHKFLEENWDRLANLPSPEGAPQLFKNINPAEEFGVSALIANPLYHLEELLDSMKVKRLSESVYEGEGEVTITSGESISLAYSFQASSPEEADKLLLEYKKLMTTKGLKVWLTHWMMANKLGKLEYRSPMIDLMKLSSKEGRKTFFSVKEKKDHWATTKILSMSRLKKTRTVKKRGTNDEIDQWIEQPLIEILGGEKERAKDEKYPTAIVVKVLTLPLLDKKGFAPHTYLNKTLGLRATDTQLAFKLQTRAGQLRGKESKSDWDSVMGASNLQKTARANKTEAKVEARRKIDRIQKAGIISDWTENSTGITVKPNKYKDST